MKVIKKTPLRARGRSDEKRQSAKDAIRDAYTNGPQKEGYLKIRNKTIKIALDNQDLP